MWNFLQPMISPIVGKLIDLIPDKNARAKAKEDFEKDLLEAVTQASNAQAKINEVEAAHSSVFVAGWRPFIGWICGVGLAWAYIVQPVVLWYISVAHPGISTIPQISTDGLYQLVLAMLGMGGLRTLEKMKGVSRETK
uniref:3TM-type holin n=1 Tax=uncultured Paraglaciecola sp. TaxID=1765024 RepID=UPI002601D2BF